MPFVLASKTVWISDPVQGFRECRVIKEDNENAYVSPLTPPSAAKVSKTGSKEKDQATIAIPKRSLKYDIAHTADDCCQLSNELSPFSILRNLELRYGLGLHHTWVSRVLIALNPFDRPQVNCSVDYLQKLAVRTLDQARSCGREQVVIYTGDAGSGKTETRKKTLAKLAEQLGDNGLCSRLRHLHPFTESYGNAATRRNANSSRHGLFIRLRNTKDGQTLLDLRTFLLERNRVILPVLAGESTFHIFSLLESDLKGWLNGAFASGSATRKLHAALTDLIIDRGGRYNSPCFSVLNCMEKNHHQPPFRLDAVMSGLQELGFDKDRCIQMMGILVAILALNYLYRLTKTAHCSSDVAECPLLRVILPTLLGVNSDSITLLLTQKCIAGTEYVSRTLHDTGVVCKSMAMDLFEALFNTTMASMVQPDQVDASNFTVSVLDIFGFENIGINSLNQLLINYANEKLQGLFVEKVLESQYRLLKEEGIDLIEFNPESTRVVLELLQLHLLPMINDVTLLSGSKPKELQDSLLMSEIYRGYKDSRILRYDMGTNVQGGVSKSFTIIHSGGCVNYCAADWVHRNSSKRLPGLADVLKSSQLHLLHDIATHLRHHETSSSPTTQQYSTLVSEFATNIAQLSNVLEGADLHFVKCIRPRNGDTDTAFNRTYVLEQMSRLSIPPLVTILQGCFETRIPYEETDRLLGLQGRMKIPVKLAILKKILKISRVDCGSYRLGRTQLFITKDGCRSLRAYLNVHDDLMKDFSFRHEATWCSIKSSIWAVRFLCKLKIQANSLRISSGECAPPADDFAEETGNVDSLYRVQTEVIGEEQALSQDGVCPQSESSATKPLQSEVRISEMEPTEEASRITSTIPNLPKKNASESDSVIDLAGESQSSDRGSARKMSSVETHDSPGGDMGTDVLSRESVARESVMWQHNGAIKRIMSLKPLEEGDAKFEVLLVHIGFRCWSLILTNEVNNVRLTTDSEALHAVHDIDLNALKSSKWEELTYEFKVGLNALVWRPIEVQAISASHDGTSVVLIDKRNNIFNLTVQSNGNFTKRFLGSLPQNSLPQSLQVDSLVELTTPGNPVKLISLLVREGPSIILVSANPAGRDQIEILQYFTVQLPVQNKCPLGVQYPNLLIWHNLPQVLLLIWDGDLIAYNLQVFSHWMLLPIPPMSFVSPMNFISHKMISASSTSTTVILLTKEGCILRLSWSSELKYVVPASDIFDKVSFPALTLTLIRDLRSSSSLRNITWSSIVAQGAMYDPNDVYIAVSGREGEIVKVSMSNRLELALRLRPSFTSHKSYFNALCGSRSSLQCLIMASEPDWLLLLLDLELSALMSVKALPDSRLIKLQEEDFS